MRILCIGLLVFVATSFSVAAQDAVYLIRHSEKELSGADPKLTPEGRQRAAEWAVMLQHVGISAIITSDAQRTQETGGIIAKELGLSPSALPKGDTAGLVDVLEFDHEADTVLIVAHAETIPRILEGLGVLEDINIGESNIGESDFANLFVVLGPSSDAPVYIHLLMP